jgi:hypothetical protein
VVAGCAIAVKENPVISQALVENVNTSIPDKPIIHSELMNNDNAYMKIPTQDMHRLANFVTELEKRFRVLGERWQILVGQLGPYIRKKEANP